MKINEEVLDTDNSSSQEDKDKGTNIKVDTEAPSTSNKGLDNNSTNSTDGNKKTSTKMIVASGTVGTVNWELDDSGVMSLSSGTIEPNSTIPLSEASRATKLIFSGSITVSRNTRTDIFNGFSSVETIEGISNLNTNNLRDFSNMFSGLTSLISLDLSNWNTSNVTNMRNMLVNLPSLEELSIRGWDLSNVTPVNASNPGNSNYPALFDLPSNGMFSGATKLKKLDASHIILNHMSTGLFATTSTSQYISANVTGAGYGYEIKGGGLLSNTVEEINLSGVTMSTSYVSARDFMFSGLKLKILDLSNVDFDFIASGNFGHYTPFIDLELLEHLTLSNSIIRHSPSSGVSLIALKPRTTIKEIDLTNVNTSNVTNMSNMFSNMISLNNLDLSSFNTVNVRDMSNMFHNMISLNNLFLGNFDTSNVTNMSNMFSNMTSLNSLNLDSFNTNNVTDMSGMFSNSDNLNELSLGANTRIHNSGLTAISPSLDSDGNYNTGGWNLDSNSVSNYFTSSQDFMENFDGTYPGKYVRTRGILDLRANNIVVNRSNLSTEGMLEQDILQAAKAKLSLIGHDMDLIGDLTIKNTQVFNKDTKPGVYTLILSSAIDPNIEKIIKVFVFDDDSATVQDDTIIYSKNFQVNASERIAIDEAKILERGNVKAYEISSGNELDLVPLDASKINNFQHSTTLDDHQFNLETVQTKVKRTLTVGIQPDNSMINVTIPMAAIYNVTDASGVVKSKSYNIVNNSKDISLKVGFALNTQLNNNDFLSDSNTTFLPDFPELNQKPDGTESIHLIFNAKKGNSQTSQVMLSDQNNVEWSDTLSKNNSTNNTINFWLSGRYNGHVPLLSEINRKHQSKLTLHFEVSNN
jgi:surface protein